jgi:hypothetical protein
VTSASIPPLRSDRAPAGRGILAAPRAGAPSDDNLSADRQQQLAAQHAAFDFDAAQRAEIERERAALQAMLMAWLKNEDEIMKKWIALI